MPWTKPGATKTARADNQALQIRFYYGDASASPPNAPRVAVSVTIDDPDSIGTITATYDQAIANLTSLTGPQKTSLGSLLLTIRDEALAALGFTFS